MSTMNENMESGYDLLTKWVRALMYIAIASLVNSMMNFLPFVPASVTTWISRGIMAIMAVCMFRLAPANERYKIAGILRAVMLGCALFTVFGFGSRIPTLAASIVSIIAVYLEYKAHSELVAEKDAKLSGKWRSLFLWGILAAVLLSLGSLIVAAILVRAGMEGDASRISGIAVGLLSVPQRIVDVVYIIYINKMISIFNEAEIQ